MSSSTNSDTPSDSTPSTPPSTGFGRRRLLQLAGVGTAALAVGAAGGSALASDDVAATRTAVTSDWDKTFPRDPDVRHEKVTFTNRLGIPLVADLYAPRRLRGRAPALTVGHPFGGVKEQSSGLYAQTLAARGFVTIAHDASYNGESGGQLPHFIASPEAYVEDFSAAIDFLGLHPDVDRDRIGALGICGSGGFALAAAQIDPRIKAVATSTMYDMGRDRRQQLGDTATEEQRRDELVRLGQQRWAEAAGAPTQNIVGTPRTISEDSPAFAKDFYDYYRTPRGQHPRSTAEMSWNSNGALMQFYPFQNMGWISPRPVLLVHGENASSLYFSEDAYAQARDPRELYIVPGASHVDLYDRTDLIPWDKFESFYQQHL